MFAQSFKISRFIHTSIIKPTTLPKFDRYQLSSMTTKATLPHLVPLEDQDFTSHSTTDSGAAWDHKFVSWNVNGLRAWCKKKSHNYFKYDKDPDVIHLQETKCPEDQIPGEAKLKGYHCYWYSAKKKGYSSTGLLSKVKPLKVIKGIGIEEHDQEGRTITAEFEKFFFVGVYVPNSGRGLVRLDYRITEWNVEFKNFLEKLQKSKPVILCGDLNVAHKEIDLSHPKTNQKSAGFTMGERLGFGDLMGLNKEGELIEDAKLQLIDTFRYLNPEKTQAYTFWSAMGGCRAKNVGWRLDYFMISPELKENLCDSLIRNGVLGSDHCPIVLLMNFNNSKK